jgi:hypothetical protein
MPALVAGIHVFCRLDKEDVDGRDKPGHDGGYAAYFFSEVLLLRGSSAGLT